MRNFGQLSYLGATTIPSSCLINVVNAAIRIQNTGKRGGAHWGGAWNASRALAAAATTNVNTINPTLVSDFAKRWNELSRFGKSYYFKKLGNHI